MYFYALYLSIPLKITACLVLLLKERYKTLDIYGSILSSYSTVSFHLILLGLPLDMGCYKTLYLSLNALRL